METIFIAEKQKLELFSDMDFMLNELYHLKKPDSLPPEQKGYAPSNPLIFKKLQTRQPNLSELPAQSIAERILRQLSDEKKVVDRYFHYQSSNVYYFINEEGIKFILSNKSYLKEYQNKLEAQQSAQIKEKKIEEDEAKLDRISKKVNVFTQVGGLFVAIIVAYFTYVSLQQNKTIKDLENRLEKIEKSLSHQELNNLPD